MNCRTKTLAGIIGMATIIGSLFMFRAAWASAYEWLTYYGVEVTDDNCCSSGEAFTLTWTVNTNGSYYEYRAGYYATSTSATSTPSVWTVLPIESPTSTCAIEGTVSSRVNDKCATYAPMTNATTTLWLRATTNYSGCGTYTPTPDVTNCGDIVSSTHTLTP